jgi:hypothetical protein
MFDKLKEKAAAGAQALFEKELHARLDEKIEMFKSLKPADVQDDAKYAAIIIQPLWLYVKLQSGGALAAAQKVVKFNIEERFSKGLFHVRNELIRVEDGNVKLVPDFRDRLTPTIMEAVKDTK